MPLSASLRTTSLAITLPILLSISSGTVRAQTTTLDDGTFRLISAGRDIGSETFSIQQSGGDTNATINARGNVTIDSAGRTEELHAALQITGPNLQLSAYNLRTLGDKQQEQITGRLAGTRFISRILSPTGEELREYLVSNRAVLIDQGITYQYYFLARRMQGQGDAAQIPVIIPRQSRQVVVTVTRRGTAAVTIGRQRLDAQVLVVDYPGGDEVHLWVDDRARILQLEIPARAFVARRTTPPR